MIETKQVTRKPSVVPAVLCAMLTILMITTVQSFPSYAAKASSGESVLVFDDGTGAVKEDLSGVDTEDESDLVKETEAYRGMQDTGAALTKGQLVVNFATQFIGNPYRFGGSSLTAGTDCSGFVMSVFRQFGVVLPHSSKGQMNYGMPVSGGLAAAQPGDVLIYSGHVGIYLGNNQMLSALGTKYGITVIAANYKPIKAIRRMLV